MGRAAPIAADARGKTMADSILIIDDDARLAAMVSDYLAAC